MKNHITKFSSGTRLPKVSDVATIVEVYEDPTLGYELECVNKDGTTNWLATFLPEEVVMELISEHT